MHITDDAVKTQPAKSKVVITLSSFTPYLTYLAELPNQDKHILRLTYARY